MAELDFISKFSGEEIDNILDKSQELLNKGYTFSGVATPETDPGTPSLKVFYLTTTAGKYANFDNITVESGKLTVLLYNGSMWQNQVLDLPKEANVVQTVGNSTSDVMSQDAVTDGISAHNTSSTSHADIRKLLNTCVGLPAYDSSSYKITFTTLAGASVEIDLPIEQLALRYNAETESIEFDNADGTTTSIPVSAFVKEYVTSLSGAQQSQAFANLGWKVHVISESVIGSSDAVSDDEKAARLSATALLVKETGIVYNFGIEEGSFRKFFGLFTNTQCHSLLVTVSSGAITTTIPWLHDQDAVSFTRDQSMVPDTQKQRARSNIGVQSADELLEDADFIAQLKTKLGIA